MMVTKKTSKNAGTKSRLKVGKLELNKQTIRDLTPDKQKQVKGGGVSESRKPTCSCLAAC